MSAVDLATGHHQGAGLPSDDPGDMQSRGYCGAILLTRYELWRPPADAFATYGYNHRSFDFVFSGDRNVAPITATDLALEREMFADARARGWVTDAPYVRPHRETPGNSTICCGNRAAYPDPPRFPFGDAAAWVAIVTAAHKEAPPMPPTRPPQFFPALPPFVSWCLFNHPTLGRCAAGVDDVGHVFCDPPEAYLGGPWDDHTNQPKPYWANRRAARIVARTDGPGYLIEPTSATEPGYAYPEGKP